MTGGQVAHLHGVTHIYILPRIACTRSPLHDSFAYLSQKHAVHLDVLADLKLLQSQVSKNDNTISLEYFKLTYLSQNTFRFQ